MVVYRELVVVLLIRRYVADSNHIFDIECGGFRKQVIIQDTDVDS